jgi:hypothetical protein
MNRRARGVPGGSFEPDQQPRKPLLRPVVPHGHRERLPLADDYNQLLSPRDARVNQVPLVQEVLLGRHRNHDSRKLGPPGLVEGDGVGQGHLLQMSGLGAVFQGCAQPPVPSSSRICRPEHECQMSQRKNRERATLHLHLRGLPQARTLLRLPALPPERAPTPGVLLPARGRTHLRPQLRAVCSVRERARVTSVRRTLRSLDIPRSRSATAAASRPGPSRGRFQDGPGAWVGP